MLGAVVDCDADVSIFGEVHMTVLSIFEWNIELKRVITLVRSDAHSTQLGQRMPTTSTS